MFLVTKVEVPYIVQAQFYLFMLLWARGILACKKNAGEGTLRLHMDQEK